jgi:hypothetical protein
VRVVSFTVCRVRFCCGCRVAVVYMAPALVMRAVSAEYEAYTRWTEAVKRGDTTGTALAESFVVTLRPPEPRVSRVSRVPCVSCGQCRGPATPMCGSGWRSWPPSTTLCWPDCRSPTPTGPTATRSNTCTPRYPTWSTLVFSVQT